MSDRQIKKGDKKLQEDEKLPLKQGSQTTYLSNNTGCFVLIHFVLRVKTFRKREYMFVFIRGTAKGRKPSV